MWRVSKFVIAGFPVLFLTGHALALLIDGEGEAKVSFAWLIAAPLTACLACLHRCRRDGMEGWLPVAASMLLWAGGMTAATFSSLILASTGEDRLSMLLYVLYGVPLIFALVSPETDRWQVRLVDAVLAAALGYLFYVNVFRLSSAFGTQAENVSALTLMFDIENAYIALFAVLQFAFRSDARAPFFRATTAYAIAYMLTAAYINHFEQAIDYGFWPDLLIDLPFLIIAWFAMRPWRPHSTVIPAKPHPFARVLRAGSPLLIPVTLLTVSVLLVSYDPQIAVAGCVAASLGYGVRTVLTQLHNLEEQDQLALLTHLDALTGIPNRRCFDEVLLREWSRRDRSAGQLVLLMIDVDHFKLLNDHYGHSVGDERLRTIAAALAGCARRETDLVARYGGEEFGAILTSTDIENAALVAERMRAAVEAQALPSPAAGGVVTVSIGLAGVDGMEGDVQAFVRLADAALYDAKRKGRNQVARRTSTGLRSENLLTVIPGGRL